MCFSLIFFIIIVRVASLERLLNKSSFLFLCLKSAYSILEGLNSPFLEICLVQGFILGINASIGEDIFETKLLSFITGIPVYQVIECCIH